MSIEHSMGKETRKLDPAVSRSRLFLNDPSKIIIQIDVYQYDKSYEIQNHKTCILILIHLGGEKKEITLSLLQKTNLIA